MIKKQRVAGDSIAFAGKSEALLREALAKAGVDCCVPNASSLRIRPPWSDSLRKILISLPEKKPKIQRPVRQNT